MYKSLIRPLLFLVSPERVHHMVMGLLKFAHSIPGVPFLMRSIYKVDDPKLRRTVFGIDFPNPVGLAAGFDKDARFFKELGDLGFGFIEIGTLTPKGQPGNDKPRMFRLPADKGLINRMGFNNQGVDQAVQRLKGRRSDMIIGGNIGKNKVTSNEQALEDYIITFNKLYDHVDYFVVNVSSPNTPNLRDLQDKEPLSRIILALMKERTEKSVHKPILLKIAPDLTEGQLDDIVELSLQTGLDGLIATNTTISRENLNTPKGRIEEIGAGGLSGAPVLDRSTEVVRYLYQKLGDKVPIIAVGGIFTAEDALQKLNAGAKLVQVYTGFIYEGPGMIKKINKGILKSGMNG